MQRHMVVLWFTDGLGEAIAAHLVRRGLDAQALSGTAAAAAFAEAWDACGASAGAAVVGPEDGLTAVLLHTEPTAVRLVLVQTSAGPPAPEEAPAGTALVRLRLDSRPGRAGDAAEALTDQLERLGLLPSAAYTQEEEGLVASRLEALGYLG